MMTILITLDIDGTITDKHRDISPKVLDYFSDLHNQGIHLAFITGRTFSWGYQVLEQLSIPYYFSVQNGAITMKMPERNIESKKYLDSSVFSTMNAICATEHTDYVVYTGYEGDDICYYRANEFDKNLLNYLLERTKRTKEDWCAVENFDALSISGFASIKCFGDQTSAKRIAENIEKQLNLHAPVIRDPINPEYYVIQATHSGVSKGRAVTTLKELIGNSCKVISAGDDVNDIPMLQAADIKIVMATAPDHMHALADIVAPPASVNGIIQGINDALERLK